MNKATILTCCYNGEQFVDNCLSCVLQQTYPYIEFIFIDDGSTDGSYRKALEYRNAFHKKGYVFLVLQQKNQGAGYAIAYGLKYATGDYISCYDVDDILYPQSVEKRVRFLDAHRAFGIVRTNGYRNWKGEKRLFVDSKEEKQKEYIFEDLLLGRTNNWAGSYMVRSNLLWNVYPQHMIYPSKYGQNLQILLAVSYKAKCGFIDEPLMEYVYNPDSFTNCNQSFDYQYECLKGYKAIYENVLKKLDVDDEKLLSRFESNYNRLFCDLAIRYKSKRLYEENFVQLKSKERPDDIYTYHYYLSTGKKTLALYYRLKMFIKRKLRFR